ncbi:hypothetical protein MMC14_007056 [Varicellaria rhodocarpa]|nr:hypothetical protein [Varicellaria rhodocarpa]
MIGTSGPIRVPAPTSRPPMDDFKHNTVVWIAFILGEKKVCCQAETAISYCGELGILSQGWVRDSARKAKYPPPRLKRQEPRSPGHSIPLLSQTSESLTSFYSATYWEKSIKWQSILANSELKVLLKPSLFHRFLAPYKFLNLLADLDSDAEQVNIFADNFEDYDYKYKRRRTFSHRRTSPVLSQCSIPSTASSTELFGLSVIDPEESPLLSLSHKGE